MDSPLATMKSKKAIHNPGLPKGGMSSNEAGKNTSKAEIIMVLRMARAAVAPI